MILGSVFLFLALALWLILDGDQLVKRVRLLLLGSAILLALLIGVAAISISGARCA